MWHSQNLTVSNRKLKDICLKHSFYTVSFISNLSIFFLPVDLALTPWDSSESYSPWALPWVSGLITYNNNNNYSNISLSVYRGQFILLTLLYIWVTLKYQFRALLILRLLRFPSKLCKYYRKSYWRHLKKAVKNNGYLMNIMKKIFNQYFTQVNIKCY